MSEKKDWNAEFAKQKAAHDRERDEKLRKSKAAAADTEKEPFGPKRFRKLYEELNPASFDEYTPWETLIKESEYDYYVVTPDLMSLTELVKHLKWLEGYG